MSAIEWSLGAEQQLFEIRLSFATSAAQDRFEKHLDAALEQLEAFPESARMNPTLRRQDVRSLLVGDYRLTVLLLEDRLLVFSMVYAHSGAAFD
jgi:plasmid stabilization system protein ParE